MRYSLILPYYDKPEIYYSLVTIRNYAPRNDLEVIVVEDSKNFEDPDMHKILMDTIAPYPFVRVIQDHLVSINSANKYNVGVAAAEGEIILLSNPETLHLTDILGYCDGQDFSNKYYVFDCANVKVVVKGDKLEVGFISWYQHATINRQYHFCSAISKQNFYKAGKFPDFLSNGLAYEDDFFLARVKQAGIEVLSIHDQQVGHIDHPRSYGISPEEKARLYKINEDLWKKACQEGKF